MEKTPKQEKTSNQLYDELIQRMDERILARGGKVGRGGLQSQIILNPPKHLVEQHRAAQQKQTKNGDEKE